MIGCLHEVASGRAKASTASGTPLLPLNVLIPAGRLQEPVVAFWIASMDASGRCCMRRAAKPATWGAAIDVPDKERIPAPGTHDHTSAPGPISVGVMRFGTSSICSLDERYQI
ncbi:hypothetical protein AX289_31990 [Methylorubrum populi]|nr:hypothetical protein AX289_31990 [Methylorubrum populi]